MEAEEGLVAPSLEIKKDNEASQEKFLVTTISNEGSVTFNVKIPSAGSYVIWTRAIGRSGTEDSFFVAVDNANEDVFDVAFNNWSNDFQWMKMNGRGGTSTPLTLNPRIFNLSAGSHSIRFRGREFNTALDFMIITNDQSYTPPNNFKGAISKIKAKNPQANSVTIKWKTKDSPSSSQVEWGTSTNYSNISALDTVMLQKHKVELTGLQPNVEYHYRVRSVDAQGLTFVSGDYAFLTPSQ